MNTSDYRVGDVSASILFLSLIARFISRFSTYNGLALSAFGDVVIKHVFVDSRLAFRNFQERFIESFTRKIITSMPSLTDVFFERKIVAGSRIVVTIGL